MSADSEKLRERTEEEEKTLFKVFETKDGRLLCFTQSTDNPWVQCELTKEAEITNPTLWSDGSKVSLTAPVEASGS